MGVLKKLLITLLVGFIAKKAYDGLYGIPPIPVVPASNYWGKGAPKPDDKTIKPFKIDVPENVLTDLKKRLDLEVRVQPSLEGVNFNYGFPAEELKKVVTFWRTKYDWRAREKLLNAVPHFKTQVSGLDIHFIHAKPAKDKLPKGVKVVPLLLLHGWPGTIKEFYGIIPMLTTPFKDMDFVFEVIAPSLPGYGFSEAAHKPGLSPAHMAAIFRQLMVRLGHDKFYLQGGDWGSLIANNLAILFPQNVLGMHTNMCAANTPASNLYLMISSLWPSLFMDQRLEEQLFPLGDFFANLILESGYMHLQASKPDTIGAALSNSPVGLAAYILEKFSTWTDMKNRDLPDGGLTRKFKLEDMLDNVMIYWVTGSITSSMRLYAECFNHNYTAAAWDKLPIYVPSFCARLPNELINQPDFMLRLKYTQLLPTVMPKPGEEPLYSAVNPPRGGHFAAFEEPKLMAHSIFHGVKLFMQYNQQTKR